MMSDTDKSAAGTDPYELPPIDWARRYHALGYTPVPLYTIDQCMSGWRHKSPCPEKSHGKHPLINWRGIQHITVAHIDKWWGDHPDAGIALLTGARSGFDVIDIDPDNGGDYQLLTDTYQGIPDQPHTISGSGGQHVWVTHPGVPTTNGMAQTIGLPGIDYRGDGGLIVVAPTIHYTGNRYRFTSLPPPAPVTLPWLETMARKKDTDRKARQKAAEQRLQYLRDNPPEPPTEAKTRTGANMLAVAVEKILESGANAGRAGGRHDTVIAQSRWIGGLIPEGYVTEDDVRRDLLDAAVTVAGPEREAEMAEAISWGIGEGVGAPWAPEETPYEPDVPPPSIVDMPTIHGEEPQRPATTWRPIDLSEVLSRPLERRKPDKLMRSDGRALLYGGCVNLLFGSSESSKSWIAMLVAVEVVTAGGNVVIVDLESDVVEIMLRLRALGLDNTQITEHVSYISPDEMLRRIVKGPGSMPANTDLDLADAVTNADLIIVDAMGELYSTHGLDPLSNRDAPLVTGWLRRLASGTGAAVIAIDHTPHAPREGGAKAPIGAQHKRAAVTGVAYEVISTSQLAPGEVGKVSLKINKDRPGGVREHALGTTAARVTIDATDPEHITATIDPPRDGPSDALISCMADVSDMLAAYPEGLPKKKVEELVPRRRDIVRDALDRLHEMGNVERTAGQRGAVMNVLKTPFPTPEPTVLEVPL